jgi:hypothetical protein
METRNKVSTRQEDWSVEGQVGGKNHATLLGKDNLPFAQVVALPAT